MRNQEGAGRAVTEFTLRKENKSFLSEDARFESAFRLNCLLKCFENSFWGRRLGATEKEGK